MSYSGKDYSKLRMIILIVICMLPLLAYPGMIGMLSAYSQIKGLVLFYPVYVIASGVCAIICYPERSEISWILIILMLMSHIGLWYLVLTHA